jgi:hypothetical protein
VISILRNWRCSLQKSKIGSGSCEYGFPRANVVCVSVLRSIEIIENRRRVVEGVVDSGFAGERGMVGEIRSRIEFSPSASKSATRSVNV